MCEDLIVPEIREIKPDEYPFLRDMLYEAIYFPDETERLPKSIVDEPHLSKYVDHFGRNGDFGVVLVDENEIVGAAWARLFTREEESYGFVAEGIPELSISLFSPYRNQGFGTQMISALAGILQKNGFKQLSLSVNKRNPAARLYNRLRFELVSENETVFIMLKTL